MNIHTINAIVLGYLLVIVAGLINYLAGNTVGFFMAVLSVAATYAAENLRTQRLWDPAFGCMLLAAGACTLSYLIWFLG